MTIATATAPSPAAANPIVRQLANEGLFIGLTAWTQPSLARHLYPPTIKTAEERLHFYSSRFPLTEVDATFYRPLAERTAALWVARTPPGFVIDVKAFRLLTQHPTPPSQLWRDLRDELPPELLARANIYARDLPREVVAEVLRRFTAALEPLRTAGRLGLVLFQLPRYVYPSPASFGYLEWVATQCSGLQLAIEFRQRRWMDDEHRDETIDFLTRHHLAFVCVDEPKGLPSTLPPIAVATADVAEVKFHGRNAVQWEARGVTPADRHRYNYRARELAEWVPRIRALHEGGRPVHILMNNCADGACVRNAKSLARLLADDLG
jgi:uncharacterized protein YecE (DUF72 family)